MKSFTVLSALILTLCFSIAGIAGINYPVQNGTGLAVRNAINAAFSEVSANAVQKPAFHGYSGNEAARLNNETSARAGLGKTVSGYSAKLTNISGMATKFVNLTGKGPVASWKGRTGDVWPEYGDYRWYDIDMTYSNLADITLRSYTSLQDKPVLFNDKRLSNLSTTVHNDVSEGAGFNLGAPTATTYITAAKGTAAKPTQTGVAFTNTVFNSGCVTISGDGSYFTVNKAGYYILEANGKWSDTKTNGIKGTASLKGILFKTVQTGSPYVSAINYTNGLGTSMIYGTVLLGVGDQISLAVLDFGAQSYFFNPEMHITYAGPLFPTGTTRYGVLSMGGAFNNSTGVSGVDPTFTNASSLISPYVTTNAFSAYSSNPLHNNNGAGVVTVTPSQVSCTGGSESGDTYVDFSQGKDFIMSLGALTAVQLVPKPTGQTVGHHANLTIIGGSSYCTVYMNTLFSIIGVPFATGAGGSCSYLSYPEITIAPGTSIVLPFYWDGAHWVYGNNATWGYEATYGKVTANEGTFKNISCSQNFNAATAKKLQTARNIDGVPFDGTTSINPLPNVTNDAQLKRAAGDFASFGNKAPASADHLLVEDSAASWAKKYINIGDLPNAPLTPPMLSNFSFVLTNLPMGTGNWGPIAWNGTVFCATAGGVSSTAAATSPDGVTWTARTLPSSSSWTGIAWNGTSFCAVAWGTTAAATSPDGVTWTARTMPSGADWTAIAWNGTVFCAIATNGNAAATSPDGVTWTARTLPSSALWSAIAWNGSVFCAIATSGNAAATSPDGVTWTARTLPSSANWSAIAWNGTVFCAVAGGPSTTAATSPDGVTWTARTLPLSANWSGIAWNSTVFCAVPGYPLPATGSIVAVSHDGITWTTQPLPSSLGWSSITSNGSAFCAIGTGRYAAVSTGQLLKNNNAGGFSGAIPGVDYQLPVSGCLIGMQYLTAGSTFTPDPGTNQIVIKMVGGGGGGGYNLGSGGGAGGYLEKRITGFSGTASYAIGAAGAAGVSGTQPVAGGNTTFTYGGVTYTAYGGGNGGNDAVAAGTGAPVSINGDLNVGGGDGTNGASQYAGGVGGASFFGGGGSRGGSAVVPGAGGGGGGSSTSGGAGRAGLIIVQEYN